MSDWLIRDPKLLVALFEEELYRIAPQAQQSAVAAEPLIAASAPVAYDYLGGNNRFFLILVNEPGQAYLEDGNREVLLKILQAKGMDLNDVALLNITHYPGLKFGQLKAFFSCSRMCLFGIDPQPLGLPALPSNEVSVHEEVKILASFSLLELQQTQHKKVAFWQVMKNF